MDLDFMARTSLFDNVEILLRWLHVIAGITWIGFLYFFNFVNVPLQGVLDDAGKKAVNPKLMPRVLWWFRWGAMITLLAGLVLFTQLYMYKRGQGFGPGSNFLTADGAIADRAWWIMLGMGFGIIMWFNVWFVIWPAQKKLLSGQAGDQAGALRKRALIFSRTNTWLSGPMLFGMLSASHYSSINVTTAIVFFAIALVATWGAIVSSYKVGTSV